MSRTILLRLRQAPETTSKRGFAHGEVALDPNLLVAHPGASRLNQKLIFRRWLGANFVR